MKKTILLLIIVLLIQTICFGEDKKIVVFLENYFESTSFKYETHKINNQEMLFAYRIIDEKAIFNKAIIFTYQQDTLFVPILYFTGNKVLDKNGIVLFQGIINTQNFYGWKLEVVDKNNAFSTSFYTDKAKHVTDGPTFIWDNTISNFKLFVIDKSML